MRELNLHTVCEEAQCPNIGVVLGTTARDLHDPGDRLHTRLFVLRVCRTAALPLVDTAEPVRVAMRSGRST